MATRIILYLFALADLVVFYIFYQEWAAWILLVAAVGLPWLSLLVSLPGMLRFRLTLEVPPRLTVGVPARVRVRGRSALFEPPFKVKLRVTRLTTAQRWIVSPGEPLPTGHCGGLRVEAAGCRVFECLGLLWLRMRNVEPVTAVVMPEPLALPVPPELASYLARAWKPKSGGGFGENHELRLYRPGDSMNQVHWKLTAKTGKLTVREPMVPQQGSLVLSMDVSGTEQELDRKFGRLLWLGEYLLEQGVAFQIRAMTEKGVQSWAVEDRQQFQKSLGELLCSGPAAGSICDRPVPCLWHYHIGGEPDEA